MIRGKIVEGNGVHLAEVEVELIDGQYLGNVIALPPNAPTTTLFHEYEEMVNSIQLTAEDELSRVIAGLSPRFVCDEGWQRRIFNLQIYPLGRRLSFKLIDAPG